MHLYHYTSHESAHRIWEEKRFQSEENTGEVFFTDTPGPESAAYGYGDTVVRVWVDPDTARLDDEFPSGERHWAIKADDLTRNSFISVMPRSGKLSRKQIQELAYEARRTWGSLLEFWNEREDAHDPVLTGVDTEAVRAVLERWAQRLPGEKWDTRLWGRGPQ